jgi:mRNA-degrading endonuclease YafQ of YafQ-DinJ toxin-antitoxin module
MSFKVVPTSHFSKEAKRLTKKYPSLKDTLKKFVRMLRDEPRQGSPLGM